MPTPRAAEEEQEEKKEEEEESVLATTLDQDGSWLLLDTDLDHTSLRTKQVAQHVPSLHPP